MIDECEVDGGNLKSNFRQSRDRLSFSYRLLLFALFLALNVLDLLFEGHCERRWIFGRGSHSIASDSLDLRLRRIAALVDSSPAYQSLNPR
jgi:hypothetical protein